MMPASTPGLRAKWRVDRAIKSGRKILQEDLDLMTKEGIPTPENLNQEELLFTPSPQVDPIPLQVNLNQQEPSKDTVQSLKDTVTGGNTLPPKKLSKTEKACVDFYQYEFGPICVLVLWFILADLDKASFYAPSPDECKTASVALGRLTARAADRLNTPTWVGDVLVSVIDLKDLGFAAAAYLDRIGVMGKLSSYYSGMASRMRNGANNAGQTVRNNGQVQQDGYIDISKLGLGEQYRPI
jgi:hypothetical protein